MLPEPSIDATIAHNRSTWLMRVVASCHTCYAYGAIDDNHDIAVKMPHPVNLVIALTAAPGVVLTYASVDTFVGTGVLVSLAPVLATPVTYVMAMEVGLMRRSPSCKPHIGSSLRAQGVCNGVRQQDPD